MLSYRHGFHAGNYADVLKHSALSLVLEHMCKKDKPFAYIDTHAGAGGYSLKGEMANKTGEFTEGALKLWAARPRESELAPYIHALKQNNPNGSLNYYPGSPLVALAFLRSHDAMSLFELHPKDVESLRKNVPSKRRFKIEQKDGYEGLKSALPPVSRRGVVLIDPSYEIKHDYKASVRAIDAAQKRFATGVYMLWYPVVDRKMVQSMEKQWTKLGVSNVLQIEYCREEDSPEYGMTGTGLFIVNPPWKLAEQMKTVMDTMNRHLDAGKATVSINQLTAE
ncbi:23S rRNA (adenine(2030)-N(6))-methyltransferase RlmJ [Gammaproteobacteria bacterium 45_16_T64]|nr:23S rRNA (adenine(2030)-N(6))-methyltransferase RlmJ [Gammaproteobacteria bacterium 45_16_T64]